MKTRKLLLLFILMTCQFAWASSGKLTVIKDMAYGEHQRDRLDFYRPNNRKRLPLVIMIHGGGFQAGSKEFYENSPLKKLLLKKGFAVAAINYPFLEHMPLIEIMRHGARALQFIRSKSNHPLVNIDKENVFLYGGSAGGGISLWLNSHDDLANPKSQIALERESTKPKGIIHFNSQFSFNFLKWGEVIGLDFTFHYGDEDFQSFYGSGCHFELLTTLETCKDAIADLDMTAQLDSNDSPILVLDSSDPNGDLKKRGYYLHNAFHGNYVVDIASSVGLDAEYVQITNQNRKDSSKLILSKLKDWLR